MGKFEVYQTRTGYKFHLKAANGEVIATSEVYLTQAACIKGAHSVVRYAAAAHIADLTAGQKACNPKFELYEDKAGKFRFRLKARNGKVIAVSEDYQTKAACENGIESVRKNAGGAQIVLE